MRCYAAMIASNHGLDAWIFRRAVGPRAPVGRRHVRCTGSAASWTWPASSANSGPSRRTTTDVAFRKDTASSRTGSGPVNRATIRAAITAAIKDVGYLHIPEPAPTTPPRRNPPPPPPRLRQIQTFTEHAGALRR
jgi:hypothetical protein